MLSYLTPPEIAERFRCSPEKVIGWIRRGELRAVNVAEKLGGRPRYRIAAADLAAFEAKRSATPLPKVQRRKKAGSELVRYF